MRDDSLLGPASSGHWGNCSVIKGKREKISFTQDIFWFFFLVQGCKPIYFCCKRGQLDWFVGIPQWPCEGTAVFNTTKYFTVSGGITG